jgi:phosphopantetheine adenylyltransferase
MLAMLNQWINTHEIVSTSMRRRGSMGEISNISLPSTLSTMSEPKRAPSVLLKPLKDFAPKTNLFEIKNFNYAKEKQDEIARRNKKAYSETSSQKEMNRKLKMKMGMQMARNLSKLLGKMGKKKEEE